MAVGIFLLLAYRELRRLEMEVLDLLYPKDKNGERQGVIDITLLSQIDVDQFYGIEINEFPVRIAEAALWLTDHQMNMQLADMFGIAYVRLPLRTSAHIHHANALHVEWKDILPPDKCRYVFGNPPYSGRQMQSAEQKKDMVEVVKGIKKAGELDYVSLWFIRTAQYMQHTSIQAAFVSTNSITQGEQVSILWKPLCEVYGIKINFAHRTFKWNIGKTHEQKLRTSAVYVVIIGFATFDTKKKFIFDYDTPTSEENFIQVDCINHYLINTPIIFVNNRSKPICDIPKVKFGNMPIDNGNFLFTDKEKIDFLKKEPKAEKLIQPFINAKEYLHGQKKWVLWLKDINPNEYSKLPLIMERIQKVKKFRLNSPRKTTRNYPYYHLFCEIRQPSSNYILIPSITSEKRAYIPMSFFTPTTIVGNKCHIISEGTMFHFGILQSKMHMVWMKTVCGRLKSDYNYSSEIVYNNFPWPEAVSEKQQQQIEAAAQRILEARAVWPHSTLAQLYNPLTMPENLLHAHQHLDTLVDRAYRKQPFHSEMERIQFLFALYQTYIKREHTEQRLTHEKKPKIRKTLAKKTANSTSINDNRLQKPLKYLLIFQSTTTHLSILRDKLQNAA